MDQLIILVVNFGIGWVIGSELEYWCPLDRSKPVAPQLIGYIPQFVLAIMILCAIVVWINPILKDFLK